ncbi:MAG: tetratricopeptide repeat protein [Bacteroidales bacterium]|nr:tetratricopeptide repeat protein [Bacteroidales bacterium]
MEREKRGRRGRALMSGAGRRCLPIVVGLACSVASVAQYETSYEFMMAQEAVAQGNNSEAYDLLIKELEKHPDNAAAHNWLGYLYIQAGQYEDAADVLEKSLKIKATGQTAVYAHKSLSELMQQIGKEDLALAHLDKAVKAEPGAYSLAYRALYWLDKKEYDKAEKDIQEALKKDGASKTALLSRLSEIKRSRGDYDGAVVAARKAMESQTEPSIDPYVQLFKAQVGKADWTGAAETFVKTAADVRSEAWRVIVDALTSVPVGQADQVLEVLDRRIAELKRDEKKNEDEIDILNWAASGLAMTDGQYERQIEYMGQTREADWDTYAKAYLALHDVAKAEEKLREAIAEEADAKTVRDTRIFIAKEKEDYEEAVRLQEEEIEDNLLKADKYVEMARLCMIVDGGDCRRAREYNDKALMLSREDLSANMQDALLKHLGGEEAEAKKAAEKVLGLLGNYASIDRVCAYALLGDKKKVGEESVRLVGDCVYKITLRESYVRMAEMYAMMGDRRKMEESLGKAVEEGYSAARYLETSPYMKEYRGSKEFKEIVRKAANNKKQ